MQTYLRAMHLWGIDQSHFDDFVLVLDVAPSAFFVLSEKFIEDKQDCPHGNRVLYLAHRLEVSSQYHPFHSFCFASY